MVTQYCLCNTWLLLPACNQGFFPRLNVKQTCDRVRDYVNSLIANVEGLAIKPAPTYLVVHVCIYTYVCRISIIFRAWLYIGIKWIPIRYSRQPHSTLSRPRFKILCVKFVKKIFYSLKKTFKTIDRQVLLFCFLFPIFYHIKYLVDHGWKVSTCIARYAVFFI